MATTTVDRKTLLVVDDDEGTRDWLAVLLSREGYAVALAPNGDEALRLLRNGFTPDLVVLDMVMPAGSGWQFLEQVRTLPHLRSLPVVMLTGAPLDRRSAESYGCAGFLAKPIRKESLLAEIYRCLR
jgi:CheY-like chemotaxis protein